MTGRYECPITACGWSYDFPTVTAVSLLWGGMLPDSVYASARARALRDQSVIRSHCESHPVAEWVAELQRERERAAAVASPFQRTPLRTH